MGDVSVTVITRNEAHNIGACLESVRWASEIVVVDQFSTDSTVDIARKCGAQVFEEPWHGYAGQKNIAVDKAKGPWVLSLDADERVPDALREEIARVTSEDSQVLGYFIARKNFFCGKWIRHGGWYPDYTLRLFRKDAGRFAERSVHERVVVPGRTTHLKTPLEHYTYRSIADYLLRMERYSRLAAEELRRQGTSPSVFALLFRPFFTFLKMYVLKRGFMDGGEGLFLAVSYAYYTFLKYARIQEVTPVDSV